MEYTIKDLAEQVGVSKQAIADKIKKLNLQNDLTRIKNRFVLSQTQADLVISAFQENYQDKSQSKFTKQDDELLYDIVKTLQLQLEEKDKQIAFYQEQNQHLTGMIAQGQALQAGTLQAHLLTEPEQKKSTSIFDRIFGKEQKNGK